MEILLRTFDLNVLQDALSQKEQTTRALIKREVNAPTISEYLPFLQMQ